MSPARAAGCASGGPEAAPTTPWLQGLGQGGLLLAPHGVVFIILLWLIGEGGALGKLIGSTSRESASLISTGAIFTAPGLAAGGRATSHRA